MNHDDRARIRVRIVYALTGEVWEKALELSRGTTAIEAVEISGIVDEIPGLEMAGLNLGVFGERVDEHYMLDEGDRVEIYRALVADPKEVRRKLAREGKVMGRPGGNTG